MGLKRSLKSSHQSNSKQHNFYQLINKEFHHKVYNISTCYFMIYLKLSSDEPPNTHNISTIQAGESKSEHVFIPIYTYRKYPLMV